MTNRDENIIQVYPTAGYEPGAGLPMGVWRGMSRVTGDASGGTLQNRLIFNQTGARFNSNDYSLEQFGLENGVSTAVTLQINTQNMLGTFALDDTVGLRFGVDLEDPIAADVAPNVRDLRLPLHMWIGHQNTAEIQCFLQAQSVNILNTVQTFYAMGYYWGPGARNAPGGIKYPTNPGMLG